LEFGISIHSVIIGVSLGSADEEFVALLFALSFHQFFEGLGLGNMLAEAQMTTKKSDRTLSRTYAVLSGLVYSLTTPIGIGIGIGISFAENTGRYPNMFLFCF
jgi:zinc transporter 1/2/3